MRPSRELEGGTVTAVDGASAWRAGTGRRPRSPRPRAGVGSAGNYSDLAVDVRGMTSMAVLEALADSRRFGVKFKDVALDDCRVFVLPHVEGDEPTEKEEAAAVELRGAAKIGKTVGNIFLRVRLPSTQAPADSE